MFGGLLRLIELRGIQAAGKTTLARSWLKAHSDLARVNRDDIRNMMFGDSFRRHREPVILECEKACAEIAIKHGYNVVVDDTNFSRIEHWKDLAEKLNIVHEVRKVEVSVKEAIRRDSLRPNPVGAVAIRATAKRSVRG